MAPLDHRADRGLRRDERAPDVQLHDPVPRVARVVLGRVERLAGPAADGVDDDVDPAEAIGRLAATIRSASASSVASPTTARPSEPAAWTRSTAASSVPWRPAGDGDLRPGARERLGDGRPDARRRRPGSRATRPSRLKMSSCVIGASRLIDYRARRGMQSASSAYDRERYRRTSTSERAMTLDLDGLIPATVLPMHADGSIDEPALRVVHRLGRRPGTGRAGDQRRHRRGPAPDPRREGPGPADRARRDRPADRRRPGRTVDRRRRPPGDATSRRPAPTPCSSSRSRPT